MYVCIMSVYVCMFIYFSLIRNVYILRTKMYKCFIYALTSMYVCMYTYIYVILFIFDSIFLFQIPDIPACIHY